MPLINQAGKEKSIEHRLNRYTFGPFAGILEVAAARSLLSYASIPGQTAIVAPTHTLASYCVAPPSSVRSASTCCTTTAYVDRRPESTRARSQNAILRAESAGHVKSLLIDPCVL